MTEFRGIAFSLIVYMVFCQLVDSANSEYDPSQYCDLEKYCTADGSVTSRLHIGCRNNYTTSKSNFKVLKLKYSDQNFIVNELNQFRSDVALGEIYAKKLTPSTFSYMKKLKWNYELDHLLQLTFKKHSNKTFYCMATSEDHTPIQIVMSFKQPQPLSLKKIFSLAIDELKSKSLQDYSEARQNEIINSSQCYHPETWAFACVAGEKNLALNDKEIVVRCAFYGKKFKKSEDDFKFGELCSGCGNIGCSDLFPGLCGSDINKNRGEKGMIGVDGERGRRSYDGAKGHKGFKGNKGTVGKEGSKGDKGLRGLIGLTGAPGPIAAKGEKGKPGKTANPEDCPGIPGEKGYKGSYGYNGRDGLDGDDGDKGQPATQTKGNKGDSGLSIKGEKGDNGENGDIGLPGLQGNEGPWGDAGDTYTEITVAKKVVCTPGMPGSPGLPGPPGKQGPKGEPPEFIDIIKPVTTEAYKDIF